MNCSHHPPGPVAPDLGGKYIALTPDIRRIGSNTKVLIRLRDCPTNTFPSNWCPSSCVALPVVGFTNKPFNYRDLA